MALDAIASYTGSAVTEAGQKTWMTNLRSWLARMGGETLAAPAGFGKAIYGLIHSNSVAGDVVNDIDITVGGAMDATGLYWMTGAASTKKIDASWAVGSAQGGLDTGSVGNSDYYIWIIARSDTGVVDYLFSLSSTAPTMPTSYDFKRLIGWFKRLGATNVLFHAYETEGGGYELYWDAPTLDINIAGALTTTRRTDALKGPLNFSVLANIDIQIFDASSACGVHICCPDQTDSGPGYTAAPLFNVNASSSFRGTRNMWVRTSPTGTIAARADISTVDEYCVSTVGFRDARRN